MDTKSRIENNYLALTKTEKKIANYILQDNDYSIVNMTLLEMSKQLRLGEASIIRFCRKLGFRGFQDLKLSMAIEDAQEKEAGESGEIDRNRVMEKMIEAIHGTNDCLDWQRLQEALKLMDTPQPLYFYGMGSSGLSAEVAENRFLRVGRRCKAVKESHLQIFQSSIMGPEDVIVALSLSGATSDLLDAVKIARDNGCRIIAITNHENSPLAGMADCVLLTDAPDSPITGGTIESVVAQLFVIDLLLDGYSEANRESVHSYRNKVSISISNKYDENDGRK